MKNIILVILGVLSFTIGGALVLAWPVFVYLSIFEFDAPSRGPWDYPARYAIVCALLAYPIPYILALIFLIRQWHRDRFHVLTSLSGLIPFLYIAGFFTIIVLISTTMSHKTIAPNVILKTDGTYYSLVDNNGRVIVDQNVISYEVIGSKQLVLVRRAPLRLVIDNITTYNLSNNLYYAVNTLNGSVSAPLSKSEFQKKYALPDESQVFKDSMQMPGE
ncbi:MAG TPA: hypothetical protein VMG59_00320 [Phycisphaerae bacterium]|nr:hypothetical protein [Phycisphaerae bacterium]